RECYIGANGALICQRLAESNALLHALAHHGQRSLSDSDAAHTVMNASRTETALRNLKATTFTQQYVGNRNANVVIGDIAVAVWRVVVAEDGEQPFYFYSWCIHGNQHHGLLQMLLGCRISLAHEDSDLTARVACTRRPPFAAVNHILIAFA